MISMSYPAAFDKFVWIDTNNMFSKNSFEFVKYELNMGSDIPCCWRFLTNIVLNNLLWLSEVEFTKKCFTNFKILITLF